MLKSDAAGPNDDHEAERMFDNISSTFKQFIVQGKDWIGNAKNVVRLYLLFTNIF